MEGQGEAPVGGPGEHQLPPPYHPQAATPPPEEPRSFWDPPAGDATSGPPSNVQGGPAESWGSTNFTVAVIDPKRERLRALLVRLGTLVALVVGVAVGVKVGGPPVTRWIERVTATTTTTTTTRPDPCRDSFQRARVDPSEPNRTATVTSCTEQQWLDAQAAQPIPGATLREFCVVRGGVPAPACSAIDALVLAEAQAFAAAMATTTTTPPPITRLPSSSYPSGGSTYVYPVPSFGDPSGNYSGQLPSETPRNGYPNNPSGNYGGRIPSGGSGL